MSFNPLAIFAMVLFGAVMVNVWCWKWYDRLEDDGNRVHCKPKGGKEGGS